MMLQFSVYFEDGSSKLIEIDKPAGAHPDSIAAAAEGLLEAEKTGKRVSKIGRTGINPFSSPETGLVSTDNLVTREKTLEILQMSCRPMKEKYKPLFLVR